MAEKDYRVDAGWPSSHKFMKLCRRLGELAQLAVFRLWAYVRLHRPTGELTGLDDEDIEAVSGWNGGPGAFVDCLSELRFIERSDAGHWRIHDWEQENPWAAAAPGRQAHARKVNHNKWHVQRGIVEASCALCVTNGVGGDTSAQSDTDTTDSYIESSIPIHTFTEPKKKKGSKSRAPLFADDSVEMKTAVLLRDELRRIGVLRSKPDLQKWAADCRLLFEVDGRDPQTVTEVIRFVISDEHLTQYVRSPGALRGTWRNGAPRWDSFVERMKGRNPKTGKGGAAHDFSDLDF